MLNKHENIVIIVMLVVLVLVIIGALPTDKTEKSTK